MNEYNECAANLAYEKPNMAKREYRRDLEVYVRRWEHSGKLGVESIIDIIKYTLWIEEQYYYSIYKLQEKNKQIEERLKKLENK